MCYWNNHVDGTVCYCETRDSHAHDVTMSLDSTNSVSLSSLSEYDSDNERLVESSVHFQDTFVVLHPPAISNFVIKNQ